MAEFGFRAQVVPAGQGDEDGKGDPGQGDPVTAGHVAEVVIVIVMAQTALQVRVGQEIDAGKRTDDAGVLHLIGEFDETRGGVHQHADHEQGQVADEVELHQVEPSAATPGQVDAEKGEGTP